jgi:hypothetical protein
LRDSGLVARHGPRFDASISVCRQGPAAPTSQAMSLPTRDEDGVLTYVLAE